MAEVLIRLLAETVKENFLHLKTNLFNQNNLPHTIIGSDYSWDHPECSADNRPSLPEIQKVHGDEEAGQGVVTVAYGPFYRAWESNVWKKAKEVAWEHVWRNSIEKNEDKTIRVYVEAVKKVKDKARALYKHDDPINRLSGDDFIYMMITDGCFLLQVALFVLGRSKKLKHLLDHPVFGQLEGDDKVSMIRDAVSSMFVVGNQIPLVVLNELMGQSFFKNVVNKGIWEQPMDLERWALFELLLVPAVLDARGGRGGAVIIPNALLRDYSLSRRQRGNPFSILRYLVGLITSRTPFSAWCKTRKSPLRKANDLLHGLWLLMTGLSHSKENNGVDLDYVYAGEDDSTSRSDHFYDVVLPTVRSASELKKVGIVFQHNEGTRINGIRFQKIMLRASYLVLPRILFDSEKHLFMLLNNLIRYEVTHFGQSKRKVCEYLQLMRELIRSADDAKVLADNRIIVVDPNLEKKVPLLFEELPIPQVMRSHGGTLRRVRDELNCYTHPSPFKKIGEVLSLVVFLTLIQTVYTVLSFHLKN